MQHQGFGVTGDGKGVVQHEIGVLKFYSHGTANSSQWNVTTLQSLQHAGICYKNCVENFALSYLCQSAEMIK
jgi:hypothetical protein